MASTSASTFAPYRSSKYPPAEPGALGYEPLKAAVGGRYRDPRLLGPPKGGHSAPQVHLFKALVLLFLPLDVIAYHLCVPSYCGYKVSPRPEVLTYEVPLLLAVYASQVYRTLSLDKPDHLRHCVFWWDRN